MKRHALLRPLPVALTGVLAACAVETPAPSDDGTTGGMGGTGGAVAMGVGGSPTGDVSTGGMMVVAPAAGGMVADPCAPLAGTIVPQVTSISVTSPGGGGPVKGEPLVLTITLANAGTGVGPITVAPKIDSQRFSDFEGVPAGSAETTLCSNGAEVVIEAGPFLDDDPAGKHYAVGSGDYTVSSVDITSGGMVTSLTDLGETSFHVATSGALLIPVVYEQNYFDVITGLTTSTPEDYLVQAMNRPVQIFTPDSLDDADGAGSYQEFPGGFDEMMGVKHLFRSFSGFPGESVSDEGWCEDGRYYGEQVLGLSTPWGTGHGTQTHRHGFDYLIGLHSAMGGGVACGWQDVQISSLIYDDVDRQQIVAVHESAHLFGAAHCNDVGNGSGGDLLGYVMCSGEIHANYPGKFVFHSVSRGKMASVWD